MIACFGFDVLRACSSSDSGGVTIAASFPLMVWRVERVGGWCFVARLVGFWTPHHNQNSNGPNVSVRSFQFLQCRR
jgi:hypothetical protein